MTYPLAWPTAWCSPNFQKWELLSGMWHVLPKNGRPLRPPFPSDRRDPDEILKRLIAIFILIMLCIVVSGAVWKFELHKKLFRSSYDSVAGG
ncbi:hypothetical protein NECAME_15944 [Necator americanus]|uniref:Uncharacterized protein n=1 Tax=Necator americanus TaxID=51031 RepID=W2SF14_NECAM|nr:hypothetical protein NECAME_15944 [Necator americanus]ETN68209.1 hypothetical protein NECAME_15944 [Necator americanus]